MAEGVVLAVLLAVIPLQLLLSIVNSVDMRRHGLDGAWEYSWAAMYVPFAGLVVVAAYLADRSSLLDERGEIDEHGE